MGTGQRSVFAKCKMILIWIGLWSVEPGESATHSYTLVRTPSMAFWFGCFSQCLGINKHLICDLLRCIMQIGVVHKLRKLFSVCRLN